jgi:prepilin-type N-terminal cleavage/methylation domain-containing protein
MVGSNKKFNGFTFVELLISLAITAMIMAAVCTAFNAYATNFQQNQAIGKSINDCRQALAKITQQLRTATAVDPACGNNECVFLSASGENMKYYLSGSKLYLLGETGNYVVCDNVTAASFIKNTAIDKGVTFVKSVQISMTVVNCGISTTMPAAVVIRKSLN